MQIHQISSQSKQRSDFIFSHDALCQKPHGLQWLMFFGIHPFSSETDFLNPDFCLSLIATYHVSLPLISQGGLLRVPPLFSAISTLTVTSKGVSCNNCLLGKHTYIHQPCYVLPRDWKRHSDQSPCLTGSHCTVYTDQTIRRERILILCRRWTKFSLMWSFLKFSFFSFFSSLVIHRGTKTKYFWNRKIPDHTNLILD